MTVVTNENNRDINNVDSEGIRGMWEVEENWKVKRKKKKEGGGRMWTIS